MIPAALHLHSTFSDGEFTLAALRERCRADGFRAALMADHGDAFDAPAIDRFTRECAASSDDDFLFVPGLEFSCRDRMHIVGYGVTSLVDSDEPETVIAHIRDHSGIAVIAHPKTEHFPIIESLRVLPHGVEAWNTKYDGRAAPRPVTFELIRRMRARGQMVLAFYGLDLHWRFQFRGLVNQIDAPALRTGELLAALAAGTFLAECGGTTLLPTGELEESVARRFARRHARSLAVRNVLRESKRFADRVGIPTPATLKAQLRRLF